MSMTKKEGRGGYPLPLREQDGGARKLMCKSPGSENILNCSRGGALTLLGGLRQRSGRSENIPDCSVVRSRGLGWYSSNQIVPCSSCLAINILLLLPFILERIPVSQVRVERSGMKPLTNEMSVKEVDLIGCRIKRAEGKRGNGL